MRAFFVHPLARLLSYLSMKRAIAVLALAVLLAPAFVAAEPSPEMRSAVVFIANYNRDGNFVGWGSGFFVDEGIVVTNRHVIESGQTYRVYATGSDDAVNQECYTRITKTDIRINLEDDVAYIRVFLPCEHGVMNFADDPEDNSSVSVLGYPFRGTVSSSLTLKTTSGVVTGTTDEGWLTTDAPLDIGNSGGPVVNNTEVVGVAVAKSVDSSGKFVTGFFIPSTVIYAGLIYANNSDFGYLAKGETPPLPRSSSSASSSSAASSSISSHSSSSSSWSSSSASASQSSAVSSQSSRPSSEAPNPMHDRVCARVQKRFTSDASTIERINRRLAKRFGFQCPLQSQR